MTRTWKTRLADDAEGVVPLIAHAPLRRARGRLRLHPRHLTAAASVQVAGRRLRQRRRSPPTTPPPPPTSTARVPACPPQALASVGLTPGAAVTYGGTTFTWPDTEPGAKDNVVSSGQTVRLSGSGSRLTFLGTCTWGDGKGSGKVVYADGTEQAFSVEVPDWYWANPAAAVVLPYRNIPSGQDDTPVSLFTFGVDLEPTRNCAPWCCRRSATAFESGAPALHIFAMTSPDPSHGAMCPRSHRGPEDPKSSEADVHDSQSTRSAGVARRPERPRSAQWAGAAAAGCPAAAAAAYTADGTLFDTTPAVHRAARLLPDHHRQVTLRAVARRHRPLQGHRPGRANHRGGHQPGRTARRFPHVSRADRERRRLLDRRTAEPAAALPAPAAEIAGPANVPHRFALNDTNDGYTGPYRDWDAWERELDVLALHGVNEVLVYIGGDAVYHDTFRQFGYSDAEMRAWIPAPAHQPWWLLQNMSGFGGPVSRQLLERRADLAAQDRRPGARAGHDPGAARLLRHRPGRLRRAKHGGARPCPQGTWVRLQAPRLARPAHRRTSHEVADAFYRAPDELFGDITMYKMDLLHEGGNPGDVPVGEAAQAVETARCSSAHPGAIWAILGWQTNPPGAIARRGRQVPHAHRGRPVRPLHHRHGPGERLGRHPVRLRQRSGTSAATPRWAPTPRTGLAQYRSGATRTAARSPGSPRCRRPPTTTRPRSRSSPNSPGRRAPSTSTTGSPRTPCPATAARTRTPPPPGTIRDTAYGTTREDAWSEAPDGLFGARPSLGADKAGRLGPGGRPLRHRRTSTQPSANCSWSRRGCATAPPTPTTSLDVTRQALSNRSRVLLPRIKAAYEAGDRAASTG